MKVYIAGKITGDQGYQAKFRRAAAGLRMCGNIVLNPAELPEGRFRLSTNSRTKREFVFLLFSDHNEL